MPRQKVFLGARFLPRNARTSPYASPLNNTSLHDKPSMLPLANSFHPVAKLPTAVLLRMQANLLTLLVMTKQADAAQIRPHGKDNLPLKFHGPRIATHEANPAMSRESVHSAHSLIQCSRGSCAASNIWREPHEATAEWQSTASSCGINEGCSTHDAARSGREDNLTTTTKNHALPSCWHGTGL